ncbi:MAG: 2-oxo acid dehydrogenase subunit E2 [Aigarchaeota archaeon]|nr:2-oxo acid dehydrogenase subunit E2 [Candidatus Pelearchaeum maunauluense]
MTLLKLPDIGEGISEGEIIRWLVKEGDFVKKYQPLVEVMTVKVNVEIPSPYEGQVVKLLAREGQVVKVGEPIAEIQTSQEQAETPTTPRQPATQTAQPTRPQEQRVLATPAVRKLARELGVDLSIIKGTGPGGRITEEDVRKAASSPPTITATRPETIVGEERIPLRGLRRMIAERLVKSVSRAAPVTIFEYIDVTQLIRLRDEARQIAEERGVKITYLPFIMKALVKSLGEFPMLNATVDDEKQEIVVYKHYNFGVAVDTPEGLLVPVVKNVESKDVITLAVEISELVDRARRGALKLEDVSGGTFSITNYGAIGGLSGTPIINYPEVAILGVGRVEKRPAVEGDQLIIRPEITLALTFDHRVVDGAYVSRFMNRLKRYLENPALMII